LKPIQRNPEPHNRLYDSVRWRAIRKLVLNRDPLCILCLRRGIERGSQVADHIIPHNNDLKLFYDINNIQGVCYSCHSGVKRIQENKGIMQGCDEAGNPLDPNHWFNK